MGVFKLSKMSRCDSENLWASREIGGFPAAHFPVQIPLEVPIRLLWLNVGQVLLVGAGAGREGKGRGEGPGQSGSARCNRTKGG